MGKELAHIGNLEEWTVVTALDKVLEGARKSELKPAFWEKLKEPLAYLREKLELTDIEVVVLAMLVDADRPLTCKMMGNFLQCSKLKMMTYMTEVEALVSMRWARYRVVYEVGTSHKGISIEPEVLEALRNDRKYEPERLDGLDEQAFVDKLQKRISKGLKSRDILFEDEELWLEDFVSQNKHLPLCKMVDGINSDIHNKVLLLLIVVDYVDFGGGPHEGLHLETIDEIYPDDSECNFIRWNLKTGNHFLFKLGLIEFKCVNGVIDQEQYVLSRKAKQDLLPNYKLRSSLSHCHNMRGMKSHKSIREKSLYFNSSEERQLSQLVSLLQQDRLANIQQRLEEAGMHKGFNCLFYGSPGTGKTEAVMQIAKKTGRDIIQVDIAGMRDKWVGESEKNIKEVFTSYREQCAVSEVMPILFFNEADALINKRTEHLEHSVDKMDNAMQNILLQELEDMDGILIATTNLTSNLDKAFERRFLFKVEFHKPSVEVKTKIWTSMIATLSETDASVLAKRYDFSGGQIENVARKNTIEYILSGQHPVLSQLDAYCREELLDSKRNTVSISGFRSSCV